MGNYLPNAVQIPQGGGGGLDTSLPPRAIWHITWDALRADGSQPEFSAVANYLKNQGYCPHLMWNPFTGYIEQYYPADQSARALVAWNQDGAVCIQIETFFTPGCIVNGIKYDTVADTPCVGLDSILEWLDSFGIPRVWPLGSPQWQGNSRDAYVWNGQAGHYGHCNVPDNTHTDPGPMPDITQEDDLDAEAKNWIKETRDRIMGREQQRWFNPNTLEVRFDNFADAIPARSTDIHDVISTNNLIASQTNKILDAFSKVPGVTPELISSLRDELSAELKAATANLSVTLTTKD